MFDSFLGRKFYSKCKTNLKLIKIRLEKINKKRNSVQKFFRADIADLLKNNLDINAYGRAEGLLVEMNMSSCYKMIDKYCDCISNNLSTMDKQIECPEECREAVPSLMYAAARFADLSELRDLRNLFSTKYGNSLDSHISKEFLERLKQKPPTKEMKFQLLQEIADEASTSWDSKSLEQKLYTPPSTEHYQGKYGSFEAEDATDDIQTQTQTQTQSRFKYGKENRKMEEETTIDDQLPPSNKDNQSDKNKASHYGLVPPPPYYKKNTEHSPSTSSDSNNSAVRNEKPKPKSVRKNRFSHNTNQETDDNEGSNKSHVKDTTLQPQCRRSYGDREEKYNRGVSLPPESMLSPRTTMATPTRAVSFEPDGMKAHIHPKLPNYDDLASRIASLTSR